MSDTIKLLVVGSKPEEVVKCTLLAVKIRRYVKKLTNIQILFTSAVKGFSGIAIEDEVFVECDDEDETLEKAIGEITRILSKRRFIDLAVAAGLHDENNEVL
jgi:hypothetical protein